MAYAIVQGGTSLYKVDLSSGTATALTLPSGVTLSSTRRPRFATLNQWTVMVNSPTVNLAIDPEGNVYPMVPKAPANAPYTAAGSSTGLTGAYLTKVSFVVKDSDGNLLMESPLSPASLSVTLSNQDLSITKLPVSSDSVVTDLRIYRTASGGTTYYFLMDLPGNVATSVNNALADASLTLLPAQPSILTSPPGTSPGIPLKNIVEWKSRLWAVADDPTLVDTVLASETNKVYAWPNSLVAYPTGKDQQGIIGFAVRRNELGLLKRIGLWTISGSAGSTGINISNASIEQIGTERSGCQAPETIVVVEDTAYWLGNDGVYQWDDNGVKNISAGVVDPWFTSDTYFNRSKFKDAFAKYNPRTDCIDFHMAAAGSSNIDRWVSYSVTTGKWYGPHQTAEFTPSMALLARDANQIPVVLVGGTDGKLYTANSATISDGSGASAIDYDCYGPFHHADAPDIQHCFLELSMLSKIENAGTLSVIPTVGRLNASAGATISHDLTTGRERLRRLGDGAMLQLRMRQNTAGQHVAVYGYEVPFFEVGRR